MLTLKCYSRGAPPEKADWKPRLYRLSSTRLIMTWPLFNALAIFFRYSFAIVWCSTYSLAITVAVKTLVSDLVASLALKSMTVDSMWILFSFVLSIKLNIWSSKLFFRSSVSALCVITSSAILTSIFESSSFFLHPRSLHAEWLQVWLCFRGLGYLQWWYSGKFSLLRP